MAESPTIGDKITKYESFINETLKEDLKNLGNERDKVYAKIADYLQLKNTLEAIKNSKMNEWPLKTKMDLGCNFYVNAVVPDPSRVCVRIGLDVYVEFALDEALRFIDFKVKYLETITTSMTKRSALIKARIKMMIEGLRELQQLHLISEDKPRREIF